MKCPDYIEVDTRKCVSECRRGYVGQWSTMPEFMGRVCRPTSGANLLFVTTVGITFGAIVCCCLIVTVLYIMRRRRRKKTFRDHLIDKNLVRTEFLRQLDELRPSADYLLATLNDTRRQIRKLHVSGDMTGVQAYRPIVSDLAKLLLLINRPVELLTEVPGDWCRLFMWAQRVCDRYKPQAVGPLIDFLHSSPTATITDPRLATCQHHTFKSITTNSTTTSDSPNLQMQTFGSLISLQDFDERSAVTLPHTDPFNSNFNSLNKRRSTSDVYGSATWLEDEFFRLGLRPQDEITTEL